MSDGQPVDISEESNFEIEPIHTPDRLVNCTGKSWNKTKKQFGRCNRPICGMFTSRTRVICKK